MRKAVPVLAVAAIVLIASCSSTTPKPAATPTASPAATTTTAPATTHALIGPHGFDLAGMDSSVKACDDFYNFAVGKWRAVHPLPAQYSRFGRFEELAERNRGILNKILEDDAAQANAPRGSNAQKLGDFYASCMNEAAIETAGTSPIQPELARVNDIKDRQELLAELTRLHTLGYAPLFRVGGTNDYKNSTMIIATLGAGSIGLPDRDYYLREDGKFPKVRSEYVTHVQKMLELSGEDPAAAKSNAARILELETKLAKAMLPRTEMRNPENTYHVMPVAELASMAPAVDWTNYLTSVGISQPTLNVTQPAYVKEMNRLLNDVPLDDWKAYLRWNVIDAAAPALTKSFQEEDFNFNGRILSGQKEQKPRWRRCVDSTDQSLGWLLGQEYVRQNFTPEAKAKMNALIDNLVGALRDDIPTLSWMGPQTKEAALTKLDAFRRRIGYPDKWIDYSTVSIDRASYYNDVRAARQFAFKRNVNRIGKPDDPSEWGFMTPPTVNAFYNPSQNNITFPAGILQPPFYDPNADDAYNYGGIGTVIGHEMTHGFDDQGAKFDAQGNLRNWWTPEDQKNFQARAECIINEYGEFNVAPGININGKLVTGEAIADLGGATIALRAYEKSQQGKPRQTVDGFTPEQRFFLGFAQVWGENMAPEEQTRRALTDPHAQGPFRVNGTVQNMPAFRKAFDCGEGQPMVRAEAKRCAIW